MSKKNTNTAPAATAAVEETNVAETVTDNQAESKMDDTAPAATAAALQIPLVTSEVISSSATDPGVDARLVKVLINYPDGYKGRRFLKDGQQYEVSPESADIMIAKGIAEKV